MPAAANPLVPAEIRVTESGDPISLRFDDVYHSAQNGLAETRHVFLQGSGLPRRWQDRDRFTIVETGFGSGLNFLAVWNEWRRSAPAASRLHYLSAEKHPLTRADLELALGRWSELKPLARELLRAYPPLIPGFHRLHFDRGRVNLTVLLGDAAEMLDGLAARADAFFLDGFAPSKNSAMWSDAVFRELARIAAPGATVATYTVAGDVRRGLEAAGFRVRKRPGFGAKREMLAGCFAGGAGPASGAVPAARRATVIGAGLAGTACAERLAERGWSVDLVERHEGPAREASGNPAGVLRPALTADWGPRNRITAAASLYARNQLLSLEHLGAQPAWAAGGVLQLARSEGQLESFRRGLERMALPREFARLVDTDEGSRLCGATVAGPGVWFEPGCWASARGVCEARLQAAGAAVHRIFHRAVVSLERGQGEWRVLDGDGSVIAAAPVLVLANAAAAGALAGAPDLPLRRVRGQSTLVPAPAGRPLRAAVCREGCITPALSGFHCVGASFGENDPDPLPRGEDDAANLARIERMLPGFTAGLDPAAVVGWVGFRTMSPDRLPILGALGQDEGLYACLALGARGLAWSALAGELVASQITGEPLPLERDLAAALGPERFPVQVREMGAEPS